MLILVLTVLSTFLFNDQKVMELHFFLGVGRLWLRCKLRENADCVYSLLYLCGL